MTGFEHTLNLMSNIKPMKNFIISLFLLFSLTGNISAQEFTFESGVPAGWNAAQGSLSVSTEHYKDGVQSLCWNASGVSVLNITFPQFNIGPSNSACLQIYSPSVSNDVLMVEFQYNGATRRTANFTLNYEGWHEFNRAYTEYASTASYSVNSVRITLQPFSEGNRKIYFDQVNFNITTETGRIPGCQWIIDKQYFTTNNTLLNLYANPTDIPLETPSAQQLQDIATLKLSQKRTPPAGTPAEVTTAKNYVNNYLKVVRNPDGSVSGRVINTTASGLTTTTVTELVSRLEILAAAALSDASNQTVFNNYVDHLLDQGFAEGCSFQIGITDYTNARNIPAKILNALPACDAHQQTELLKLVRWISYYGYMYEPELTYLSELNSDLIYLYIPHMLAVAALQPDNQYALREMKAFKRYMERNTEYVPGGSDILKPDGTGFHHKTHYNNYMYAYQTWTECLYSLTGTSFRIAPEAYLRFKKAIISIYTMATLGADSQRYYANSLSGRNPFDSGIKLFYSKTLFENLVTIGNDCLGMADTELEGAYNYFFQTNKYAVPAWNREGFFQFNYSPIGIYRKNNWVVTMHAPTSKLWGAEIYNNQNRFGRYQSDGTLEVLYTGALTRSGYPANGTGGGWDWNVIPGATTVHYVSWQEMMPYKSLTGRFDQYTKTKNFSGALSWGDYGMFACDFDQVDTWSGQAFTPTNLIFKKSMFAFDGMIISMGSGIGSSGTYDNSMRTATNLFQEIIVSGSNPLILDGNSLSNPYSSTITPDAGHWILTPAGTGYYIPSGNDDLALFFQNQTTPKENGSDYASPLTTSLAAKAYINHGIKPSGKKYNFVVFPGSNAANMQEMATKINNGEVYTIHEQSDNMHALIYRPLNITACSFFKAVDNLSLNLIKSVSGENLLMFKPNPNETSYDLAVCNPNLRPQANSTYDWVATSSTITYTLKGTWFPGGTYENVVFSHPVSDETQMTVTCKEGETTYIRIKKEDTSTNKLLADNNPVTFNSSKDEIRIVFNPSTENSVNVKVFSIGGQELLSENVNSYSSEYRINTSFLQAGIYFCVVYTLKGRKIFKWMK